MLLFPSMMALKFVSNFSSKFCNMLSNNPTGSSYFDCSSLCYHILISILQIFPWDIFALIWAFLVTPKISAEEDRGMFFRIEENACLVDENALQSENADSLLACAQMCGREASCKGANFLANKGTCSLFGEGQQAKKLERFVKRDDSFYVKKVFRKFCILCRCHLFFYSVPSQLNETFFESQIF